MNNAYECKERFTPDGKRIVSRDRGFGDSAVRGVVALAALGVVLVLVLTGHTIIAAPVSVGGLFQGIRSWFRQ